jgi:undecaprenyl-diphosphatase
MENLIELLKALILGIIQGVTEWLPVSSTGHMILFDAFWPLSFSQDFVDLFVNFIQVGSVLAVILIFFKRLYPFGSSKEHRNNTFLLWVKIIIASVPAGILGILFKDDIESKLRTPVIIAAALIIYGFLFILIERQDKIPSVKKLTDITYVQALLIGFFQVLSLIPGTSRSGSTIVGALFIGLGRTVAAEFSFMMSIPVMLGAGAISILKADVSLGLMEISVLAVGFISAFVVSLFVMKALMNFVKKHKFTPFAYYRIVLGLVILALLSFQILPV